MALPPPDPADPSAAEFVANGRLEVEGRLVDASNVTLFCAIELDGVLANAVYKPVAGERPLWDFPDGTLAGREVATYLVAARSGIGRVPPTVLRDGPLGPGMVQLWVETGDEELVDVVAPQDVPDGWRTVLHAHDRLGEPAVLVHADDEEVRGLAVLDIVVNNADRKGGHVLHATDGRVYGVDHGVSLHAEPKLRTVLWGWVGEPVPEDLMDRLHALRSAIDGDLGAELAEHLTRTEVRALRRRVDGLLSRQVFPAPNDEWRAVPWPLF